MIKPVRNDLVVFLDVDGVLDATVVRSGGLVQAVIPSLIAERVRRLAGSGQLVWATSWEPEVRHALAVALGLPSALPSVAIARGPDAHEAKRSAIERFLRINDPEDSWLGAVWIDDRIGAVDQKWAATLPYPLEVIAIDPTQKLTDGDVEKVRSAFERYERSADRPRRG